MSRNLLVLLTRIKSMRLYYLYSLKTTSDKRHKNIWSTSIRQHITLKIIEQRRFIFFGLKLYLFFIYFSYLFLWQKLLLLERSLDRGGGKKSRTTGGDYTVLALTCTPTPAGFLSSLNYNDMSKSSWLGNSTLTITVASTRMSQAYHVLSYLQISALPKVLAKN